MSADYTNLVKWSPTFMVGIHAIDEQHKGLLDLVNDMFNHVSGDEDTERQYFFSIIKEAVNYIKVHFSTEEQLMAQANYGGLARHKKEHESFVLTVIEQVKTFESGKRLALMDFTKYLKDWILTHIAIIDKTDFANVRKIMDAQTPGKM